MNPYNIQDAMQREREHDERQQEIREAFWDADMPGWREAEIDPEDRQTVSETDVHPFEREQPKPNPCVECAWENVLFLKRNTFPGHTC